MSTSPVKSKTPNQLHREFLGVNGLNPWDGANSSSRKQMFSSHIGQTLVIKGATERYNQTGMEREFGKYTFSTKMPCNAQILKVVDRYRRTHDQDSIATNPQTVIIYEDVDTKEIGMVSVQGYCSMHQYFGFEYKPKQGMSEIRVGAFVRKDTILQDSPSVTSNGGYMFGRECNMAFMSMPAASEDGIIISRDILKEFGFCTFETRVIEWGNKRFPLNLYGTDTHYKPFPDIGDRVRSDGLLMCLRTYDENLAVIEQNVKALQTPDFIFDKRVYAGGADGTVVDIRVHHDRDNMHASTPSGMELQAEKYDNARNQFYQEIIAEWQLLKRQRGESLRLTPEFHRMVVEAISVVGDSKGKRVQKLYRQAPLDDWRIEVVIKYDIVPTVGFKLTDCHGGKGVICHIAEPHEMPVDEAGNRADIVMDPNSTISRMNLGRLNEQYINSARRDVAKKLRDLLGVTKGDRDCEIKVAKLEQSNPEKVDIAWNYLMGYYQFVSPKMFVWFTSGEYQASRVRHLAEVCKKEIYNYLPPDNDPEFETIIAQLEQHYRPTYGPVSYIGNSGVRVTTVDPVRIGSVYIMLLEKTADDWTAVSSGKTQHFGVLSQVTNADKFSQPTRQQAIRALGESEVRIYVSYVGPKTTADILDRNNNPATHRQILDSILSSDQPTNIDSAVDRKKVPLGGSKPLQLVKHVAECAGWRFRYAPHVASEPTGPKLTQRAQHVLGAYKPPMAPVYQPTTTTSEPARTMPLRPLKEGAVV